ncbi:acyl-CoA N-acyltransferase [Daedalea quercina L-15889]|uniref:Acyl-CoA N-acyltransferase n=1 Tax=Daedalea quercina L-15889 TaxID=1314783 RepID=A0A165MU31_9APHY|nr:acyl-CoA N-acyltransferase [Daedalea quercina L-15889]
MEPRYLNTGIGIVPPTLPVEDYHIDTPLEEYDLNFCWPVKPLEGPGVRLEPLIPSIHAQALHVALLKDDPEKKWIYRYETPVLPETLSDLLTRAEQWRRRREQCVFAILDLSRPYVEDKPCGGRIAGIIGLRAESASDFAGEIGPVVVLPRAQRTHIMTNALSLLLTYCFSIHSQDGLELRRMGWIATATNAPSVAVPRRFGFTCEGVRRWRRVMPNPDKFDTKEAVGEYGRREAGRGWDWSCWALTFEDWRDGVKDLVHGFLARQVQRNAAWD